MLGWVVCGEWMGQSWDLRQVLQLKWVIVSGVSDASIIEPCLFVVLEQSNAWHFLSFCDPCFQEGFRNEGSECCCLSYHATNVESLGPSSRSNLRFDIWMFELPLFKIHLHSIQRRIDPRKIWNSFTKIDIINISKVFSPL